MIGTPRLIGALALLIACSEEPAVEEPSPVEAADAATRDLYASGAATQTASPPEVTPTAPTVAPGPPPTEAATDGDAAAAPPPDIKLSWDQISTLHRSFFSDPALKRTLALALAPHISGTPEVEVSYDPVAVRGRILLKVPPGGLKRPVTQRGDRIQLQDLHPLTEALDAYRLAMGSRYDLRLLNFRVRVELRGGGRTCVFGPAGDPPPDGEIISPCVSVGGQPECGEASLEGVRFAPPVAAAVRACLGLSAP